MVPTVWLKRKILNRSRGKVFENSKIFFKVFISVYSHLLKKLELSKLWGSKNPENGLFQKSRPIKKDTYFFVLFLFLLQDKKI